MKAIEIRTPDKDPAHLVLLRYYLIYCSGIAIILVLSRNGSRMPDSAHEYFNRIFLGNVFDY